MRTAYWDLSDGVTAPMILGALLDAGLEQTPWERKIQDTGLTEWRLCQTPVDTPSVRGISTGIMATGKVDTLSLASLRSDYAQRLHASVREHVMVTVDQLMKCAVFSDDVATLPDVVYILGIHLGFSMLGLDPMYRSSFGVGTGIDTPVTRLLQGTRIILDDRPAVLDRIGVAIMNSIPQKGALPPLQLRGTYSGLFIDDESNVRRSLRLYLGDAPMDSSEESIYKIETTIDDMNPELMPPLLNRLRTAGALDAWWTGAVIRSGRPGCTIVVLAPVNILSDMAEILFSETTTIGIRYNMVNRLILGRNEEEIRTGLGNVGVKTTILPDGSVRRKPSMEDCLRIAEELGRPVLSICNEISRELESL